MSNRRKHRRNLVGLEGRDAPVIHTYFLPKNNSFLASELKAKVNQSHYKPEVPRRFQEVKFSRLRDNGPGLW